MLKDGNNTELRYEFNLIYRNDDLDYEKRIREIRKQAIATIAYDINQSVQLVNNGHTGSCICLVMRWVCDY